MTDDDKIDDKIDAIVDALTRAENQLNGPAYDGVFGRLPEWIPANFHVDFRIIRERLLETYSHADLLDYIDEMRGTGMLTETTYSRPRTPFKIMRDVSILAHYQEAVRLGLDEGLALLTDKEHAGRVKKGDDYGDHQANIASNPRGKIGDGGETNNQIIGQLALASEYEELSAKELWTHYFSVLNDDLQRNPKESKAADDWRNIVIEYDFKDGRKKITGGQFAKVVSDYRTGKKLP